MVRRKVGAEAPAARSQRSGGDDAGGIGSGTDVGRGPSHTTASSGAASGATTTATTTATSRSHDTTGVEGQHDEGGVRRRNVAVADAADSNSDMSGSDSDWDERDSPEEREAIWAAAGVPLWIRKVARPKTTIVFAVLVAGWAALFATLKPALLRAPEGLSCEDLHGSLITEARRDLWESLGCQRRLYIDAAEINDAVARREGHERLWRVEEALAQLGASFPEDGLVFTGDMSRHHAAPATRTSEVASSAIPSRSGTAVAGSSGRPPIEAPTVVAIGVAVTSRSGEARRDPVVDVSQTLLARRILPSLVSTMERGFEYWVYVVYDAGDTFYDSDTGRAQVRQWFDENVAVPLAEEARPIWRTGAFVDVDEDGVNLKPAKEPRADGAATILWRAGKGAPAARHGPAASAAGADASGAKQDGDGDFAPGRTTDTRSPTTSSFDDDVKAYTKDPDFAFLPEAAAQALLHDGAPSPAAMAALTSQGAIVRLRMVRFDNRLRRPGPAFNVAMASAYADGADFMYRVNDDTSFVTPFASPMVAALRGLSPPLIGVVGPQARGGRTDILTHDFVHRTHLDVFRTYYPPVLSGWWMDDWISRVYGGLFDYALSVAAFTEQAAWRDSHGQPSNYSAVYSPHVPIDVEGFLKSGTGSNPQPGYDPGNPKGAHVALRHARPPSRAAMLEDVIVTHQEGWGERRYSVGASSKPMLHHEVLDACEALAEWIAARAAESRDRAESLRKQVQVMAAPSSQTRMRVYASDIEARAWERAAREAGSLRDLERARLFKCVHQDDCT